IEDDISALVGWRAHLADDGHLLLSVPGDPSRMGAADRAVGHFRRYGRTDLYKVLSASGFEVVFAQAYGAGLGHALEAVRNVALRGRAADLEAGTAMSGRLFQLRSRLSGAVTASAAMPFRLL